MRFFKSYSLEIKSRVFLLLLSIFSVVFVSYMFKKVLLFLVILTQDSHFNINSYLTYSFIFTDVTEVFSVYVKLFLFLGNQVFILYLCYHFLFFIYRGLTKLEFINLIFFFKIVFFFYIISIFFFNNIIFPISWNFFVSFCSPFNSVNFLTLSFEAKLGEYMSFYINLYYVCVLYFQIFSVFVLFFKYVIKKLTFVRILRKVFYYVLFVFSTMVTPPDVVSQIFVSISFILNFEFFVCYFSLRHFVLVGQPIEAN